MFRYAKPGIRFKDTSFVAFEARIGRIRRMAQV